MGEKSKSVAGGLSAAGLRFGIVVSRFNSFITDRLLAGARGALARAGATSEQVDVVDVPGSFEIPIVAKKMAQSGAYDAVICIGCVLRGETTHYDYVCSEAARGIQLAQMDTGVPMAFCLLTCDTLEQAIDRAGLKSGNKGYDAGLTAVEMGDLVRKLRAAGGAERRFKMQDAKFEKETVNQFKMQDAKLKKGGAKIRAGGHAREKAEDNAETQSTQRRRRESKTTSRKGRG